MPTDYSFRKFLLYFLKLGATGFGGPIALCGMMHRELVEERKWISDKEYNEGFALAQLAPGPVATQLAMFFGWVKAGVLGASLVGVVFILPSFLMVIAIAEFYQRYQDLSWIKSVFVALGAAVMAVIVKNVAKLVQKSLLQDAFAFMFGIINLIAVFWFRQPSALLFLASGLAMILVKAPSNQSARAFLFSPLCVMGTNMTGLWESNLAKIFIYFAKAGSFVFGSGLAIIPFLHGAVVDQFHWLSEKQFLDAVSVALITPGPAVITVAFIGYLVQGFAGALAAALGVFLPVYVFVIVLTPLYKRLVDKPEMQAFVKGVTSAAVGALVGAVILLGQQALTDFSTVLICLIVGFGLWRFKKVPDVAWLIAAGAAGAWWYR